MKGMALFEQNRDSLPLLNFSSFTLLYLNSLFNCLDHGEIYQPLFPSHSLFVNMGTTSKLGTGKECH